MLSDVLGRTRNTLTRATSALFLGGMGKVRRGNTPSRLPCSAETPTPRGRGQSLNTSRAGDRRLQLFAVNEEYLVSACHQRALNTFLLFVHTARRCYRLNDAMSSEELVGGLRFFCR